MPLKVDQNDRISVDGRKQWKTDQIRMKTMNENIAGACVYSMRIEFNLRHKVHIPIVFGRFFVNSHKKSQNGSGDSNRSIDPFSMTTKTHTFETALVWTGPKSYSDDRQDEKHFKSPKINA